MIAADMLKTLTTFTAPALTRAIRDAGYKNDSFLSAEFVGITNSGQFCYGVSYEDEDKGLKITKVFITYDPAAGRVSIDY